MSNNTPCYRWGCTEMIQRELNQIDSATLQEVVQVVKSIKINWPLPTNDFNKCQHANARFNLKKNRNRNFFNSSTPISAQQF